MSGCLVGRICQSALSGTRRAGSAHSVYTIDVVKQLTQGVRDRGRERERERAREGERESARDSSGLGQGN